MEVEQLLRHRAEELEAEITTLRAQLEAASAELAGRSDEWNLAEQELRAKLLMMAAEIKSRDEAVEIAERSVQQQKEEKALVEEVTSQRTAEADRRIQAQLRATEVAEANTQKVTDAKADLESKMEQQIVQLQKEAVAKAASVKEERNQQHETEQQLRLELTKLSARVESQAKEAESAQLVSDDNRRLLGEIEAEFDKKVVRVLNSSCLLLI